jgi:hypothetical protein
LELARPNALIPTTKGEGAAMYYYAGKAGELVINGAANIDDRSDLANARYWISLALDVPESPVPQPVEQRLQRDARALLEEEQEALKRVVTALLERKTLTREEVKVASGF